MKMGRPYTDLNHHTLYYKIVWDSKVAFVNIIQNNLEVGVPTHCCSKKRKGWGFQIRCRNALTKVGIRLWFLWLEERAKVLWKTKRLGDEYSFHVCDMMKLSLWCVFLLTIIFIFRHSFYIQYCRYFLFFIFFYHSLCHVITYVGKTSFQSQPAKNIIYLK